MQKTEPLTYGNYYHIYNRGINSTNLFYLNKNYDYFLHLYEKYILPIAETYAYCLMPNHFHLLVRINEDDVIGKSPVRVQNPDRAFRGHLNFSHLFNAYSQAINKQEHRTGSLFQRPFKRIIVDSETYLRQLIIYIHNNPVKHGFVSSPDQWSFSSYNSIVTGKKSLINNQMILSLFDDLPNFKAIHQYSAQITKEIQLEE